MMMTRSCRTLRVATAGGLLLLLAACGAGNRNPLVAPGKYQLYDCQQLAPQATGLLAREKILREAMNKAEAAPAGGLVSFVGYRAEYTQLQGNLDEVRREVKAKNCNPPPPGLFGPAAPVIAPAAPRR